jgi:sulfhydrogenase subunit beta (sulfur reductase)
MATHFIAAQELFSIIREGSVGRVYLPTSTPRLPWISALETEASEEALRQPRAVQSPKGFFLSASESVGRYGSAPSQSTLVETVPVTIVGVRACDLRALSYLDKVMLEGPFASPDYQARRNATTIISCDCVDCAESCCCTLVGGRPYAEEGFDVNLTPLAQGFVAEAATDRGHQWLRKAELGEATSEHLALRDETRKAMSERVSRQNEKFSFTARDEASVKLPDDNGDAWQAYAADCVECGACTNVCPTCHCFYLYDQALPEKSFERVRTWDSCLLSTYHRMAGGVHMKITPRPLLRSRLANRVLHKFTYSPQQYQMLGCVGCGRCIDACLGAIDIREVVQELAE